MGKNKNYNKKGVTNMTMTVCVRIKKMEASAVDASRRHDLRIGRQPAYIDSRRTENNSILINPLYKSEMKLLCEKRRFNHGAKRKMKSSSALARSGIVTFGAEAKEAIKRLSASEQDKLLLKAVWNVSEKCGVDLTGLVIHRDESAVHAHFQMPNICPDGVPLSKKHINYGELQDVAAEPFSGLGMKRGKKKALRIADGEPEHKYINRSVKRLHADLPLEIKEKELELRNLNIELKFCRVAVSEGKEKMLRKNKHRIVTREATQYPMI